MRPRLFDLFSRVVKNPAGRWNPPAGALIAQTIFLPPTVGVSLPVRLFAVARTLGFNCLGFLASLLPCDLLFLDMGSPVQD